LNGRRSDESKIAEQTTSSSLSSSGSAGAGGSKLSWYFLAVVCLSTTCVAFLIQQSLLVGSPSTTILHHTGEGGSLRVKGSNENQTYTGARTDGKSKKNDNVWPPTEQTDHEDRTIIPTCDFKAKFDANNSHYQRSGDGVIKWRHNYLAKWYDDGCEQWNLDGEWRDRDRRIYYGFAFGGEMEVLTVVLEEIYPVVDYIIILEATETWRGDPKPLFFASRNESHFSKYLDKVRYIPYSFDDDEIGPRIKNCMKNDASGIYGPGEMACRWLRQWGAREYLADVGAKDIRAHDVFVIADLDELLAREFLRALKHCDVWPEPLHSDKCSRMGCQVFGHKYHFSCTIAKNLGHFHPDLVLGRCLNLYGGEETRREWGKEKKYRRKPKGLLKAKYVGPVGWHMHSFLSTAQVAWKWFSRSGRAKSSWTLSDLKMITDQRRRCNEAESFFMFDALACEPLPHLVRENPKSWKHYIGYVDDEQLRDEFDVESHYRKVQSGIKTNFKLFHVDLRAV